MENITEVERTPGHLSFDMTGAPLEIALAVPFKTPVFGYDKVVAWAQDKAGKRLVLYWAVDAHSSPRDGVTAHPLPAPMDLALTVEFVKNWLESVDYGPEPSTDGSVEKSSRVYCEQWGQIFGHGWNSFIAIEPEWLIYGK